MEDKSSFHVTRYRIWSIRGLHKQSSVASVKIRHHSFTNLFERTKTTRQRHNSDEQYDWFTVRKLSRNFAINVLVTYLIHVFWLVVALTDKWIMTMMFWNV